MRVRSLDFLDTFVSEGEEEEAKDKSKDEDKEDDHGGDGGGDRGDGGDGLGHIPPKFFAKKKCGLLFSFPRTAKESPFTVCS